MIEERETPRYESLHITGMKGLSDEERKIFKGIGDVVGEGDLRETAVYGELRNENDSRVVNMIGFVSLSPHQSEVLNKVIENRRQNTRRIIEEADPQFLPID